MSTPVLHVIAGPNGAGKSTLALKRLVPVTHLPFVNADVLAMQWWPGEEEVHAHDASRLAAQERARLLAGRSSFITETVFSHESKVDLVRQATDLGYHVHLHVILVPVDTSVGRVGFRVARGGHSVPESKIRSRYHRLWPLVRQARSIAAQTTVYDNSSATRAYRVVARYADGKVEGRPRWPTWVPAALANDS